MCNQNINGRQIRVDFSINNNRNPEISNCLVVFGLSRDSTERELKEEFSRFGPLEKLQIVMRGNTGLSRGYAFVNYESGEDAKIAKEAMDDQKFNGRHIRVNFAMTKMPRTPTPGVYKGRLTTAQQTSDLYPMI